METRGEQQIWQRLDAGQHTAIVGSLPRSLPSSLELIRISSDTPSQTLGPLFEAQREIEHLLGAAPLIDQARQARQWVITGLRRRLLGDLPEAGAEGELVDVCNRLVQHTQQRYALAFDALDAADDTTLEQLTRMIQRRGWLRMPLLLGFRKLPAQPAGVRLLEVLRAVEGADAVVSLQAPGETPGQPGVATPASWRSLPADVLQVLRAGVVTGPGFEAELVAALLGRTPGDVYDCLQRACDAGVPIEDRGEGRFFLGEGWADALRASILPSLVAAWHRRLGVLLGESAEPEPSSAGAASSGAGAGPAASAGSSRDMSTQRGVPAPAVAGAAQPADLPAPAAAGAAQPADLPAPAVPFADVFDTPAENTNNPRPAVEVAPEARTATLPPWDARETLGSEAAAESPGSRTSTVTGPAPVPPAPGARAEAGGTLPGVTVRPAQRSAGRGPVRDAARAAGHLSAAGDIEAAAERYMIAAGQAAAVGAFGQAMEHVRRALLLVDRLPATPERRSFRIRTLITLARLQWQAVDPNPAVNVAFTLQSALETVDAVLRTLQADDPVDIMAEAHSLAASICYDLGDPKALERALDELTQAARLLLDAGDSVAAARLLNDQAAVYVRLGDPVRATHLLAQSQQVFESRADSDPVTMTELAETHHLLARLPFHARIRSGHEADAVSMGLDHARTAEQWYRQLGASRELARVWETMGRLELQRKQTEQAAEHLARALQVQSRIGDVTGLARTTAAMSEVLTMQGMHRNALMVLGDSIALNLDKGSPIGLAFNRRAYDALRRDLVDVPSPDVQLALSEVGNQLERAEAVLGRVAMPDAALG
jgi:tetratricopeptide (TPR) repeat protein